METFNPDPKPGRLILPLVLIKKRNKLQFKEGFLLIILYSIFMIVVFR